MKKIRNDNILNNETLKNLVKAFKCAFEKSYSTAYRYESLDFQAITTLYDATTDSFVNEIIIGNLGTKELTEVGRKNDIFTTVHPFTMIVRIQRKNFFSITMIRQ